MADISLGEVQRITAEKEAQYGLPSGTLFRMGRTESSFKSGQVSPKGAKGYFQFMPETAAKYGLTDPDNFEQAADAAGRYMRDNLKRYGTLELALADYNGGPKAAKALAAGKPWKETADYIAKVTGNAPGKDRPLSSAFTTGDSIDPSYSAGASDLYQQGRMDERENGGLWNGIKNIPEAVELGFQQDNSVVNWWKERGVGETDPEFYWKSPEETGKYLDGIPERHWDYILQSTSAQQAEFRRGRMLEAMENEQRLARMGVAGFGGRMVGGLADLPTLIAFVPGLGGEGLLTATSRLANAVRMGVFGAATNVAYDYAANQYKPLATANDLYISAAMGLGLGAIGGGIVNPKRFSSALAEDNAALSKFGIRESGRAQIDELDDHGVLGALGMSKDQLRARMEDLLNGGPRQSGPGVTMILPGEGEQRLFSGEGMLRRPGANDNLPEAPIAPPKEEPKAPEAPAPGEAPKAPKGDAWAPEWNTPKFESLDGKTQTLMLPSGVKRVSELASYVRKFSTNPDIVKVMDRVLKGIDLRKLDFKVLERGERFGHSAMDGALPTSKGAVMTPWGSTGGNLKMFLRGHSWATNGGNPLHHVGLNEETFVHELVHAASSYKLHALTGHGNVRFADAATQKAARELQDLTAWLRDEAKGEFGKGWATELKGRLGHNLQNEHELIAYGLTNREFQQWLRSKKLPGEPDKTLWDRFVSGLRKLLGLKAGDHNALSKVIELAGPLTQKGGVEKSLAAQLTPSHAGVPEDVVTAANAADIPEVFGWGLGLENKLGGHKAPAAVRSLAAKLFGTTIGYKGHSVVKGNAWDDTIKWSDGWTADLRKGTYPAFEKWFQAQKLPFHKKGEAFEDFGSQVSDYIRGFEGDFPAEVVQAGEHIRKLMGKVADYINNPLLDEGRIKLGLTETEIRDPNTGATSVVGTLEKNPNYLPRKHDINKWNSMVTAYGREAVEGFWARAYQAGRDGISDEAAQRWAKWYVRTVEEAHANRTYELLDGLMQGQDREALKQSLMLNGGYTEDEAIRVMDDMLPTKGADTGRMSASLKHRNTIKETYTETWTMADGTKQEVGLNDFIRSNAFDVVEPYLRRMAGNVALAKHLDVYKGNDINRIIADATENKLGSAMESGAKITAYRKDLQFAFDRILGVPQEEFSTFNKSMEMWRNFNVIRLMGGTVWNQVTELSQIVGSMGWKATLGAVKELRAMRRDIATGKAPHDLLDHLENTIGGVGAEYVARLEFSAKDDWVRHKGDTAFNRRLDQLDTGIRKVAKGVLDYTGMTPLMIQQKRVHAVALVNHWVNVANGMESKFLTKDRLAWMGLSDGDTAALKADLKKYTSPAQGEFGKRYKMDFDRWVKESPETYSKFMTAIHRESRRVIQENDLASTIPLMGTTIAKVMFQFMTFTLHGWNKSLQFALNHRDWTTLSTVLHGSMLASLTYMGRTMLSSMGMDEEERQKFLDKRMSTKQIVANSFGRISQASLLPTIFDTISPVPMFSGLRTTSDLSSFASNPTYQAINGIISMKKLVRNGLSDEYQTTQRDIKDWGRLLPLNNVFPVSTFLNSLAADYPTSEEQQ